MEEHKMPETVLIGFVGLDSPQAVAERSDLPPAGAVS
jgi:hypothetical protein